MNLLYLGDYKREEEESLTALGIDCVRVNDIGAIQMALEPSQKSQLYEIRSNRVSPSDYRNLYHVAQESGVKLATSPASFEVGSDFSMQYPLFEGLSPSALIVTADVRAGQIVQELKDRSLREPLFVRSDIESAAKYVGVEGCIIESIGENNVEEVIDNLRKHVSGFTKVIIKEMVPIKSDLKSGKQLEYRAIGMCGKFLFFDYSADDGSGLPDPCDLGLEDFASLAFDNLAAGGANGSLFLDVALTENAPIVVECKNFCNGSIKQLSALAESLQAV